MKRSRYDVGVERVDLLEKDNFDGLVRRVSTDCLLVVGEMYKYCKSRKGKSEYDELLLMSQKQENHISKQNGFLSELNKEVCELKVTIGEQSEILIGKEKPYESFSVVSSLMGDLVSCIPGRSKNRSEIESRNLIIQNLSNYVIDLEDDKTKLLFEIDDKDRILEELSSVVLRLEDDKFIGQNSIDNLNRKIEDLSSYVADLVADNSKLLEGLDNLHIQHNENIDNIVTEIETIMQKEKLESEIAFSSTIQRIYDDLEDSERCQQLITCRYDQLLQEYKDFRIKAEADLEYMDLGCLSRIASFEETISAKETETQSLKREVSLLSEENRISRKKLVTLEREKFLSKNSKQDCLKETAIVSSKNIQPVAGSVDIASILEQKLKIVKIQPPPILNKVCFDLIDPAYHNHGIILRHFKVDYQEGLIMGIDDIKTPVTTDEICKDCGRAIPFDPTKAFRYHRGTISSLGGVPKCFGYFHTRCVNSLKYTNMIINRMSANEQ